MENKFLVAVKEGDTKFVTKFLNILADNYEIQNPLPFNSMRASGESVSEFQISNDKIACKKDSEEVDDFETQTQPTIAAIKPKCLRYTVWSLALSIADQNYHSDISKLLLEYHSLVEKRVEGGGSLLHCAAIDCLVVIDKVRSAATKELQTDDVAKVERKMKILEILLKSKVLCSNALNSRRETVLHLICSHSLSFEWPEEWKKLIELILEHEVNVNLKNQEGKTALIVASENGNAQIVNLLLEWNRCFGYQCVVDAVDHSGETASMKAGKRNYIEITRLFLENDLLFAIDNADEETFKTLLDRHYLDYKRGVRLLETVRYEFGGRRIAIVFDIFPRTNSINISVLEKAAKFAVLKGKLEYFLLLIDNDFLDPYYGLSVSVFTVAPFYPEVILNSGKFDINTIDVDSNTLLHILSNACNNNYDHDYNCQGNHKTKEIHMYTELLLKYKVNVNAKNSSGKTALMLASETGCTSIVYTILSWTKRTGTWINLDAQDIDGKTALMLAARSKHPDVVKLLIDAGASTNLLDILRLNLLHHALYELPSPLKIMISGECPGYSDLDVIKTIRNVFPLYEEPFKFYGRDRVQLNKDTVETVRLLLQRSDIDVNALDVEGYSPLDRALVFLGDLSSTIQALKEKEALPVVFKKNKRKKVFSTGGRNTLHRFACYALDVNKENVYSLYKRIVTEIFGRSDKCRQTDLITAKDFNGRTPLHLATIYGDHSWDTAATLISFGCRVNETDNFGRTPLHYTQRKEVADLLIRNRADKMKKDIDGIGALKMYEMRSKQSHWYLLKKSMQRKLSSSPGEVRGCIGPLRSIRFEGESCRDTIFDEKLCIQSKKESRNMATSKINDEIREFMENLANETRSQEPRFEFQVVPAGSSYEGTKIDKPEEFDFLLVLTNLSQLCEVFQSPELPPGYVQLKRKEGCLDRIKERGFDEFFSETGILDTEKVNSRFVLFVLSIIRKSKSFGKLEAFEWDPNANISGTEANNSDGFVISTLSLRRTHPVVGNGLILDSVSVDMVPCIRIENWWPDEALRTKNDSVDHSCYLVLDRPQRKYPKVPYTKPCARISFATAESEIIKLSSIKPKYSFMIAKEMIKSAGKLTKNEVSYVLKTCFLYCIEAFTPTAEMATKRGLSFAELESKFRQLSIQFWLKNLVKCLLKFVFQDFCPSYFIPTCYIPIGDYLKRYHTRLSTETGVDDIIELYKCVFNFYRLTSINEGIIYASVPTINPIWETFDREKLISELSEEAFKELKLASK